MKPSLKIIQNNYEFIASFFDLLKPPKDANNTETDLSETVQVKFTLKARDCESEILK